MHCWPPHNIRKPIVINIPHFTQTGQGPAVDHMSPSCPARKRTAAPFPIELSLSSVMIHGKWHAIGIIRDITIRKCTEAEQKAIGEKSCNNPRRWRPSEPWPVGLPTTFNNILTAILWAIRNCRLVTLEKDSIVQGYLNEVFSAGKRAKDLVNQILAVAREAKEEIRPIQVGVNCERSS